MPYSVIVLGKDGKSVERRCGHKHDTLRGVEDCLVRLQDKGGFLDAIPPVPEWAGARIMRDDGTEELSEDEVARLWKSPKPYR